MSSTTVVTARSSAPGAKKRKVRPTKVYKKRVWKPSQYGQLQVNRRSEQFTVVSDNALGELGTAKVLPATQSTIFIGSPIQNAAGSYDIAFSMQFRLDQVVQYTDITNLCDKYRIDRISISAYFQSVLFNVQNGGASDTTIPYLEWVEDHDDANVPSFTEVRAKMGTRISPFDGPARCAKMWCKPKVAIQLYGGVVTAYEVPKTGVWVDAASANVPHYGVKGIIHGMQLPTGLTVNSLKNAIMFDVKYTVSGKDFQ